MSSGPRCVEQLGEGKGHSRDGEAGVCQCSSKVEKDPSAEQQGWGRMGGGPACPLDTPSVLHSLLF